MSDDLVPELHDIGKMVDESLMNEDGHTFRRIDDRYKNRIKDNKNWVGIKFHTGGKTPNEYKGDMDLFLLKLSDHMASAVSRMLPKKEANQAKDQAKTQNKTQRSDKKRRKSSICKLWWENEAETELISDDKEFLELIDFVNNYSSNDGTKYFEKYGKRLKECPEDKFPGLNIISLFTHSKLVGKFYRFFKKYGDDIKDNGTTLGEVYEIKKAENNFTIKLVHGKIKFHLSPVRAGDLNIFNVKERIVEFLKQRDEILFCTQDEFLAILPVNKDITSIFEKIEENLYFDVEEAEAVLYEVYPTPLAMKSRFERTNSKGFRVREKFNYAEKLIYFDLSPQIHDICDLCQMYEATKEFPRDYVYEHLCEKCRTAVRNEEYPFPLDKLCESCKNKNEKWLEETISENLCIHCFNLREKEPRAPKIVEWSESDEDFKVAWVKISLDIEELQRILEKLYEEYLKKKEFEKSREGEIRFSVLSEFQSDFENFLGDLMRKREDNGEIEGLLADKFGIANCQWILSDLFCIRIESLADITEILKIYNKLFDEYFPKFKKVASPIKLSISCSSIKFAFFWHWRFLDNPVNDVNVNLVGKGEMHLNLEQLDNILKLNEISVPQLRKLSKVSEVSKELSKILLYHKGEWRLVKKEDYEKLKKFASAVGFENILTYAKMISEEEQLVE
ncbi:hypothetical protein FHEFKHOI_01534 [Candidatus Methanoperedenaceae archaeon GB50]|nr:hypothetical protein FHEFKHOI_01534 [Candidatus Methanoperedenaceae archaeon GB50]